MAYCSFQSRQWRGWIQSCWQQPLADLDAWLAANPGTVLVAKRTRRVFRANTAQGVVYVKVIRHLQESNSLFKKVLAAVKWYCRSSRAVGVLNISNAMLARGIGCPEPVLAARRRNAAGWPEDIFISREVEYPSVLALLHQQSDGKRQEDILVSAARGIAKLHNRGFVHGDCIPGNICQAPDGALCFLDNDRTRITPVFGAEGARLNNLIQFLARLPAIANRERLVATFLQAYAEANGEEAMFGTKQKDRLMRKLETRLALLAAKRARKVQARTV